MKALCFLGEVDIFHWLFLKQSKKLNSFGKAWNVQIFEAFEMAIDFFVHWIELKSFGSV